MTARNIIAALTGGLAIAAGALPSSAIAQTYPSRPIRLIIPFAPGGPTDVVGRLIAQKMSEDLGQPIINENRPGAGGSVGMVAITGAAPDGYTLGVGSASTLAINPSIYPKLPYDTEKDLVPIGLVAVGPYTIVVHSSMPSSLSEFIAFAKARPGKINMGSSGTGSSPHMAGILFNQRVGVDAVHVPYKGGAPGLAAVMSGEVQYIFDAPMTSKSLAESGKLRILAVTSGQRSPVLPDVPTAAELGLPGFVATSWSGLVAPARTPPEIIARLSKAVRAGVQSRDLQQRFAAMGVTAESGAPEDFSRFIREESTKWSTAARNAGVKGE